MTDRALIAGLACGGAGLIVLACFLGSTTMPIDRLAAALMGRGDPADMIVVWEIRAPRAFAAYIVGATLAFCGAGLQGLLRNPLAEPGVLGVSACAALGATLSLFYGAASVSSLLTPLAAIAGALAATVILAIAAVRLSSVVSLILVGVGLSSFAGALMALLLNLAPTPFTLSDLISWTLGSVANKSYADLSLIAPFLIAGLALVLWKRRDLSLLTLGEEAAQTAGADLRSTRLFLVAGTGLMTGAAVSIAGAIGFVGITAPHLVRPFVDHDPSRTLVPSALLGGALLVAADIGVRLIPTPAELRLGVVAALIGAPIFVWIAMGRRMSHD